MSNDLLMKMLKNFNILVISFLVLTTSLFCQYRAPANSQKARIIGEFLKEQFTVLPGDQLYRAQDLWESLGSTKINVIQPTNSKSKDISKTVIIEDTQDLVEGFLKFVYNSKNETITSITITANLDKGDFYLDKFIEHEGQYEPTISNGKNVEYSGRYYFDDFIIGVIGYSDSEKTDLTITNNLNYNRINR